MDEDRSVLHQEGEAAMRGHIRERSPGHWAIILDVNDNGKRRRKWHSFAGTKRHAQVECSRLITAMSSGDYVPSNKMMLADFLFRWLDYKKARLSPLSFERYQNIVHINIVPAIGSIPLAKLRAVDLAGLYAKALERLSARTVVYIHRVLYQALGQAVRWQMLGRNPVLAVDPPKAERKEMRALDADGIVALLDAARGTSTYLPVLLAALTGMRRGEIAALRWRSVDLDNATLAVVVSLEQTAKTVREKTPKNGKGRLLALSPLLVDELRQHKARQAEHLLRHGVALTNNHHVVMRADALPYLPRSITDMFNQLLDRRPSLPRIRFHDLRHSHATALLTAGVHPKVAQERLGHHSISMTMDLYSHTMPHMQVDAVNKVDVAMRKAMARR
jgi:integrase